MEKVAVHGQKTIEIVAGPNGSGKTTFARAYFKLRNGKSRFINADTIAAGLSQDNSEQAAFYAGRIMLTAIEEAISNQESLSFESTLSGKTWLPILNGAKARGYKITIYFVYLKSPSLNLKRIRQRVREGGHSIPQKTVLRRYSRSFLNFWKIYRSLCQDWFIFDNSGSKPKKVHSMSSFDSLDESEKNCFERKFLPAGKYS